MSTENNKDQTTKTPENETQDHEATVEKESEKKEPSSVNFDNDDTTDAHDDKDTELQKLKDSLMRAVAETENLRKRSQKQIEDANKYGITSFARDMLNISDNLHRALETISPEDRKDQKIDNLMTGVEMTEKMLLQAFEKVGIRKVTPKGEKFDHNFHQAMVEVPHDELETGTVVEVFQDGYIIHDRLLRPAMVSVAKNDNSNSNDKPQKLDTTA